MLPAKKKNVFHDSAHLYDLDERKVTRDDIPFYLDYAARAQGPVLELACGTGRVAIPIAASGREVWGVDLSAPMLDRFRSKLAAQPPEVRDRVHLLQSDMCDFNLERKFALIIIAFRSFQALTEAEMQRQCLARVREHLADDGIFIINVFRPYAVLDQSWVKEETLDWEVTDPETGNMVRRTHIRKKIDPCKQVIYPDLIHYLRKPDGSEEKIVELLELKYFYEPQLRELLLANGFAIAEELGYYDRRPIAEGPELIFVCK
jgi:SAM-dependent methyltransferase